MSEELVSQTQTITVGASINEIAQRARIIDELYKRVMKRDVHYGIIPGTGSDKPSLYKAGAEKLMATFNLGAPDPTIEKTLLPEGHREYMVTLNIKHYPTGKLIGGGVGVCSTMESKYRYRNVADYEVTDEIIPKDYKERKQEYRKKGYGAKKVGGDWVWVKYGDSERSENPDIADLYNTCLKMAKKRALIDAVLTATGASDIFTQDIEDFADLGLKETVKALEAEEKPATKKYTVREQAGIWRDMTVKDVDTIPTEGGGEYYAVHFANGVVAFTKDKDLAARAYGFVPDEGEEPKVVRADVHPGRKPDSWVITKIMQEDGGDAPDREGRHGAPSDVAAV